MVNTCKGGKLPGHVKDAQNLGRRAPLEPQGRGVPEKPRSHQRMSWGLGLRAQVPFPDLHATPEMLPQAGSFGKASRLESFTRNRKDWLCYFVITPQFLCKKTRPTLLLYSPFHQAGI